MAKLQPKGDSVNNRVPFVEAHVSVTALLASCLVEDLEAGLSRATKACIADLEAFTSNPSEG